MATIVLELPDSCKALCETLPAVVAALVDLVPNASTTALDYLAVEAAVADQCAHLERAAHQDALSALDVSDPWVLVDGVVHRRVGRFEATYYTQAGPITILRSLFRQPDDPEARSLDPIALRVGTVGAGWLPGTAKAMAFLVQQNTAREAAAAMAQVHRLPYCRNSFDAVTHEVGALVARKRDVVEQTLIERFVVPEAAHSVGVSLDRVSVPVEEPKPRGRGRPKKNAPKKSVQRVYRMAWCGTITLHDAEGKTVHTIRYGRMPEGDVGALLDAMVDDVLALLAKRSTLEVVLLCDGAQELWNLLLARFTEQTLGKRPVCLVDLWHLMEKLGKAARVAHGEQARAVTERWKTRLLNSTTAATRIAEEIASWNQEWHAVGDQHPVHEALTFLENQGEAGRLNFASARARGLPVGSGNVEATCKSLFQVRMKRSGSRWHQETAEHIVMLRALALSDRWDAALDLTLSSARREVQLVA